MPKADGLKSRAHRSRKTLFFAASICIGGSLGIWSFFIEPDLVTVHRETISIPNWDSKLNGLKIAVLTDIHVGAPHIDLAKLKEIVSKTNSLQPDVVVILGDLVIHGVVGGSFVEPEKITHVLKGLNSTIGTVAVLGNHDWWYDGPRVTQALTHAGIKVLENDVIKAPHGGSHFWLAGMPDMWTRDPKIAWTLKKISDDTPVILLTHNPDLFPDVPKTVSLVLAGHTHGGQVDLPLIGRAIVPSRFGQRFAAGHIVEEGRHLFVGTGIGTSILPIRFRVAPEILLLTLNE